MIIGIVGSRDYPDLDHVRAVVRRQDPRTEIVSGGARGVDRVVREEAMRLGREFLEIAADRDDMDACQRRNGMIVAIVDQIIAFRYRNSPGTTNVLDQAHAAHKWFLLYDNPGDPDDEEASHGPAPAAPALGQNQTGPRGPRSAV